MIIAIPKYDAKIENVESGLQFSWELNRNKRLMLFLPRYENVPIKHSKETDHTAMKEKSEESDDFKYLVNSAGC